MFVGGGDDANMPTTEITADKLTDGKIGILNLMVVCKLAASNKEARRLVEGGGVFVNDEKVPNPQFAVTEEMLKEGVKIRKGKKVFHKAILGKSIDRGSRDVISVAVMNNLQRPEDNPIDIFHSGIPLAKCLILGYDFILRYCQQFFADNFRNVTEYPIYKNVNGEYKIVGSTEANSLAGKISNESPLGAALLGKGIGEEVSVETQVGIMEYKVLKIDRSI